MPGAEGLRSADLRLLAGLWLREPDAEMAHLANRRLGLPLAEPEELAAAYAELFLLSVYPYGTMFTDPNGELNGAGAQDIAAQFAADGYQPPELLEVGAPDHLGACLGFAAHLLDRQLQRAGYMATLLDWAPVCCLAVEREPAAHPFYQALARLTREWLLGQAVGRTGARQGDNALLLGLVPAADDEVGLRDVVRFFLAPARCGIFLSRSQLGRMAVSLGLRLPFGSRFEVAEALFQSAGETRQIEPLIGALEAETNLWQTEYARWAERYPNWHVAAEMWLARTSQAATQLSEMRQTILQESSQSPRPGLVVILGSGEAAPSSRAVYQWAASHIEPPIRVSILETPAGFEPNSEQVAGRIAAFLRELLAHPAAEVTVVAARRRGSALSPDDAAIIAPLYRSNLILLGPGSPTYAVRQLDHSLAWHALQARHRLGAVIVLASAGATAAGSKTLPVYEIYKVGDELHWLPGLDLLGAYGLKLAIIPHWDNTDGGPDLDTSRCYMGQERFRKLLDLLPRDITVVGIDERTALALDIEAQSCRVFGHGGVAVLSGMAERRFEHGQSFSLAELGPFRPVRPESGIPPDVWEQARAAQEPGPNQEPDDPALWAIVQERERLRSREDWAGADQLRQQLADLGWQVLDTAAGARLTPLTERTKAR